MHYIGHLPHSLSFSLYYSKPLFSFFSAAIFLHTRRYIHIHSATDSLHYLTTFNTLSKTLLQNPRNFTALKTLDSLLTHTHIIDSASSVFVIDRLSMLKKLGRAKTVLQIMRERGKASDYILFSIVVDFIIKDGTFDDAMIVWDEICGDGLKIDVSDYIVYVCKYGEGCDIKRVCERVFLGCRVLRKNCYECLVEALSRVNEGELAKRVVREMEDKGVEIDDSIYFDMFRCFCRNGDLNEADLVLKLLVRRNYPVGMCVYSNFLYALCRKGRIREANKLFRKMLANDCSTMSKNDYLKEGKRVIFQLNFKGEIPEMMAYETYFRSLCSVGKLDEAEALLKKMMKKRYVPETYVYGSFIEALFRSGREKDAMNFFYLERKKRIVKVDDIAKFVIIGLSEKGRVDDALKIFKENITCDGQGNSVHICNYILVGYWKLKRVAEAEDFFNQIRTDQFGVANLFTYTTMIHGYCDEGSFEKAFCIFEEMSNRKVVVNKELYEIIITSLCSHGRFKDAFVYLNDMIESLVFVSCPNLKKLLNYVLQEDE